MQQNIRELDGKGTESKRLDPESSLIPTRKKNRGQRAFREDLRRGPFLRRLRDGATSWPS